MDTRLSHVDAAHPDELDEEFDTFPTSRPSDIVRMRGKIPISDKLEGPQTIHSICDILLILALVLYVTPFQVIALLTGLYVLYVLRHPRFRHKHSKSLLFSRGFTCFTSYGIRGSTTSFHLSLLTPALLTGLYMLYVLWHPRFRNKLPSIPFNSCSSHGALHALRPTASEVPPQASIYPS
ncbi:hypothetical protein V6N13_066391 [Hibiscus sabdariffa]|uniref:Multiple C2 domain-containing protein n=1 Tax=Hibiscus sabdariffa TaxID=183260 RepID=A0ABR2DQA0_9ROSI